MLILNSDSGFISVFTLVPKQTGLVGLALVRCSKTFPAGHREDKEMNVAWKLRLVQLSPAILGIAIAMLLYSWGGFRADA
jgi:hypothetical protein